MEDKPFYTETRQLFDCVSTHDFDRLRHLCADDYGRVDLDMDGKTVRITDPTEWENWFRTFFAQLQQMQAHTYTDILTYNAVQDENLGYSVVDFCQHVRTNDQHRQFYGAATIVWKRTPDGWREGHWHASLIEGPAFAEDQTVMNVERQSA